MQINPNVSDFFSFTFEDFEFVDYVADPARNNNNHSENPQNRGDRKTSEYDEFPLVWYDSVHSDLFSLTGEGQRVWSACCAGFLTIKPFEPLLFYRQAVDLFRLWLCIMSNQRIGIRTD